MRTREVITPEKEIQADAIQFLNMQPSTHVWRRNTGVARIRGFHVRFGKLHAADIEGIGPNGRHIEAEAKKTGEKPDDDQLAWLEDIRSRGGIAFWFDSLDMCINEWVKAIGFHGFP